MTNIIGALPQQLQNGTPDDASQVMANFNYIAAQVNAKAAGQGANADITALAALTTPITPGQGGSTSYYGSTVGGTANAITVSALAPSGYAQQVGNRLYFIPTATSTGAVTLQVNSGTVSPIVKESALGLQPLRGDEIVSGQMVGVIFDGTNYVLLTGLSKPYTAPVAQASAATVDLGLLPSNSATLTGTTPITSFGSSADLVNPVYKLVFAGAMTLTYNATSLITPSGYNITTKPGDSATLLYLGSGNWRIIGYASSNSLVALVGGYRAKKMQVTSTTAATITAAAITLEDASGFGVRLNNYSATINTATSGLNGVDTGAIAAGTWYYAFAVYNPTTGVNGAIISLSATAPTLPAGFVFSAYIGALRTNSSAQLITTLQHNLSVQFVAGPLPSIAVGTAGNVTTPTWVAVPVFAPPNATKVKVVVYTPNSFIVMVAPNSTYGNSSSTSNAPPFDRSAYGNQSDTVELSLESSNIYWANNAYAEMWALGWEEPN